MKPAHSGTSSSRIVFKPYNDESVTISGADPLNGWSGYNSTIDQASMTGDLGFGNNQVFVDGQGRVYDYKVLSGQVDAQTRQSIDNLLLFSVFSPARSWDQPVRGTTLMSFSGISVKG